MRGASIGHRDTAIAGHPTTENAARTGGASGSAGSADSSGSTATAGAGCAARRPGVRIICRRAWIIDAREVPAPAGAGIAILHCQKQSAVRSDGGLDVSGRRRLLVPWHLCASVRIARQPFSRTVGCHIPDRSVDEAGFVLLGGAEVPGISFGSPGLPGTRMRGQRRREWRGRRSVDVCQLQRVGHVEGTRHRVPGVVGQRPQQPSASRCREQVPGVQGRQHLWRTTSRGTISNPRTT
jgi:hypothetical protein